jgi:transcription attenuation protein (tryptophan RNA-binding attenuator protein)
MEKEVVMGDSGGRYIVVKALEDGVVLMALTRGRDTRSHHSERLDAGEVMVAQFTQMTAAIKVRGRAEIMTDVGQVRSGPIPAGSKSAE